MMTLSFLLKATVILLSGLAAAWLARRNRAAVRHVLLASSFAMLLLLPVATTLTPSFEVSVPSPFEMTIAPIVAEPVVEETETPSVSSPARPADTNRGAPWKWPSAPQILSTVWIAGGVVFLLPIVIGLWQVRKLRQSARPWQEGRVLSEALAQAAGIRRDIPVLLHEALAGPMTCGVLRPVILLPRSALSWPPEDVSRALVHELEHVGRFDWLTQCVARIISAMYWFHPAVWIAWRRFALEAERACDDAVLCSPRNGDRGSDETAYADQLVHLAERLSTGAGYPHLAMANRKDLSARIAAVLDSQRPRGRAGRLALVAACLLTSILVGVISPLKLVARQTNSGTPSRAMHYDAVSIRPCEPDNQPPGPGRGGAGGTNATISPGRFSVPCVTAEQLIYLAYAAQGARPEERLINDGLGGPSNEKVVRGGPSWVHSQRDRFSIEATAPGNVTDRTVLMGAMLRTLLEDRFKLKLHRDQEDADMFALTAAKAGLKVKPMKPGDCEPDSTAAAADPAAAIRRCGNINTSFNGPNMVWTLTGLPPSSLAARLSVPVGRHVIDQTGITDPFILRLEFHPDEQTPGIPWPAERDADTSVPRGASILTALEDQLGLKLGSVKAPRGFLVIDHIERPAPDRAQPSAQIPLAEDTSQQASQQTRFEAATIKPCTNEEDLQPGRARGTAGGTNAAISPGRFAVPCVTLEQLIYLAYASYGAREDMQLANDYMGSASDATKIRGGPDWVHSHRDKWAIEATAPGVSDRYVLMGSMLRTLLEERFKLQIHRATETASMYALRVAKGGFKLKPLKDGDCDDSPGRFGPPQIKPGVPQPCGYMTSQASEGATRWHFVGFQMGILTRRLADEVHLHVIDETSITDKFIFDLQFASENAAAGASTAPSVFTALEQQLGLKLEKTTGPSGYIVVDHAERPAPDLSRALGAGRAVASSTSPGR